MRNALKGLHFFSRFAYSFSALGYRHRRRQWKDPASDFNGQRWLVTGASGGIGRAITLGAARRGAEGHELSFATNLLNHYVLTTGLIDRGLLADDGSELVDYLEGKVAV